MSRLYRLRAITRTVPLLARARGPGPAAGDRVPGCRAHCAGSRPGARFRAAATRGSRPSGDPGTTTGADFCCPGDLNRHFNF